MCDYSLHAVASRPAEVAETLISAEFRGTTTRGFASARDPTVAVCLLPGTEIAFEQDVRVRGFMFQKKVRDRMARFRQLDRSPDRHRDALEFSNGRIILVTDLVIGQKASVLQLPVNPAKPRVVIEMAAGTRPVAV
ncbi:hypothetical protein [Bradyrhizobium sp. LB5.2]|uniref:hypothetical protein n=1 Tax=unclassified Bradyrhizobium TaxID=2631580 RepID=UPI0033996008